MSSKIKNNCRLDHEKQRGGFDPTAVQNKTSSNERGQNKEQPNKLKLAKLKDVRILNSQLYLEKGDQEAPVIRGRGG